mmetsp:Transcript_149577/g.261419  ORF Transcript_149577/g.261419 Transcript_149577/m.261419 type:complete len:136 (-) Transcript_149577:130-537(-)
MIRKGADNSSGVAFSVAADEAHEEEQSPQSKKLFEFKRRYRPHHPHPSKCTQPQSSPDNGASNPSIQPQPNHANFSANEPMIQRVFDSPCDSIHAAPLEVTGCQARVPGPSLCSAMPLLPWDANGNHPTLANGES